MKRVLEPEIMDDKQQAIAYAKADFSTSNQWYVDNLIAEYPDRLHNVIDLGCGPADIPILLAKANPRVHITAVDGSAEMIKLAKESVKKAKLENRITLIQGYLPGFKSKDQSYDAILSKDLRHHLPDPMVMERM
jgi:ubiquinone/menaquinone biosynthesis C-methylase UbiE